MVARRAIVVALGVLVLAGCGRKKQRTADDAAPASAVVEPEEPDEAARAAVAAARGDDDDDADEPSSDDAAAEPERVEHDAWKVVDNRHTAHRALDGELVIDAGDVGFARYIRFGLPQPRWHLGQEVDGDRAAVADRLASLDVPLTGDQTSATQLTLRLHAADKQALTVKINGRKARRGGTVRLEGGWQTVAFPIEADRLVDGENQLVFETGGARGKIAVAWLRIGTIHPPGDQDPRRAFAFDPDGDALELDENASVAWYLSLPEGANLVGTVTAPCHVEVIVRDGDTRQVGGLLDAEQPRIDLSALGGKVVRLELAARDCPRARIEHPRITLRGPEHAALAPAAPPRFVILWVMDALRADKIPVFAPGARAKTPNLEALAKTSAVFRQYYVQGNESQTSHSSMWSSTYPAVHNVRTAGSGGSWKLARRFEVIAEELDKAGFHTIGVTGNGFVNEAGGYTQGFAEFRNMMREKGVINGVLYGRTIVDAALARLAKHRAGPAYLFLGTIDTHGPWIAREPWIDLYSPGPYDGPFQKFGTAKELGIRPGHMGCSIIPPKRDLERLRAIYDSAVSYHDQQVGRLVAKLKAWGIWDQTMLILTADHGEELFEDGRCGHGGSLRESLVRVPLLVHDPGRFPGGTVVQEGAESVDLMPTILAALGREPPAAAQGTALEPLAQGIGRGWPRPSYASMYEYAHAMRVGRWKIRVGKSGTPTIDDVVADPGETHDLRSTRPVERRMLTDELGLFLAMRARWHKATWGVVNNITAAGAAALDEARTP